MTNSAAVAVIVTASLLAFYPVTTADFTTWDDNDTVVNNPNLNPPTFAGLANHWAHPAGSLYVPLTYTTWWLIAHVARTSDGLNPWIFHGANLLLHVGAALALFRLLRRLAFDIWPAMLGALIFAVHPIQTEAVAWVSGLKDVLCGLLVILALDRYVARRMIACVALFVLAMLAKPVAIVLPAIALAIDVLVIKRGPRDAIRSTWYLFALAVPCVIWSKLAQPATQVPPLAVHLRPLIALDAIGAYVAKLIVPGHFAIDYGRTPQVVVQDRSTYLNAAVGLIALIASFRFRGLAVFLIALLPTLGMVPFEFQTKSTVADHYAYIPMIGIAMLTSAFVWKYRSIAPIVALVLCALVVRSNVQARTWLDSRTLYEHTLSVNPRSLAAHMNLTTLLLDVDPVAAERHARDALALAPDDPAMHTQLGTALAYQNRFDDAKRVFRAAAQRWPHDVAARIGLARSLLDLNRPAEAVVEYDAAMQLRPNDPSIRSMRNDAARRASTQPSQ